MKFKYSLLAWPLFAFAACTPVEDIYDEIDAEGQEVVKKAEEYVLTEADYAAISKTALKNAKTKADSTLAKAVKSELALNDFVQAADYVPAILAQTYKSWGNGSSVGVTYRSRAEQTDLEKTYAGTTYYKISDNEYGTLLGKPYGCFAPSYKAYKGVPALLKQKYSDAAAGTMVLVDYREAENEPETSDTEKFEGQTDNQSVSLYRWLLLKNGDCSWVGMSFSGNKYAQISANKSETKCDSWMITPAFTVEEGQTVSFDLKFGNFNGECLQLLVSDKFNAENGKINEADWKNVTASIPNFDEVDRPKKGYGKSFTTLTYTFEEAYVGKKVYVAFRYQGNDSKEGDKVTSTVQVDNVKIPSDSFILGVEKEDKQFHVMYTLEENKGKLNWNVVNDDQLLVVTPEDYQAMGGNIAKYGNFSNKEQPATYLPTLLRQRYPYAQEGDVIIAAYLVSDKNGAFSVSTQFNFQEGSWVVNDLFTTKSKQTFIKNDGVWKFDPTITIEHSKEDMQYLVDWVKDNKPTYLNPKDHPDNTEYLFGASSYYNNFNITLNKRRGFDPDKLFDEEDEMATKQLLEQVAEGCRMILVKNYPDAATTMNGLDLYYVVKAHCYNGADLYYNFRFKSLGKGNFEWDKNPVLVTN